MQRKYYKRSANFFELFEADSFDKELNSKECWQGLYEEEDGTFTVAAEFVYDDDTSNSGTGWYL